MKRCLACSKSFVSSSWTCSSCGTAPPILEGFPTFTPSLAHTNGGYHEAFFESIAELEAGNFWFEARNDLILWALRRHGGEVCDALELGCGTGFVTRALGRLYPTARLTAGDIHTAGLRVAAKRAPATFFIKLDARSLPFESHFDLIAAFDVLEHIDDDECVLKEMHRSLKPLGRIILTVPQHPSLWDWRDDAACHVRRYEARELRSKLISAGFHVTFETSFMALLLPAMFLRKSRLLNRSPGDSLADLAVTPLLNRVLYSVLRVERLMIELGIRFPAGGSRLLIAQRI